MPCGRPSTRPASSACSIPQVVELGEQIGGQRRVGVAVGRAPSGRDRAHRRRRRDGRRARASASPSPRSGGSRSARGAAPSAAVSRPAATVSSISQQGSTVSPTLVWMVVDVTEANFEREVLERSKTMPVVVDFWAEWCRPVQAARDGARGRRNAREGKVALAKLDTEGNPRLAAAFRIQRIPAVKAFRDGHRRGVHRRPAAGRGRALPRWARCRSEADELVETGDEARCGERSSSSPPAPTPPGHSRGSCPTAARPRRPSRSGSGRRIVRGRRAGRRLASRRTSRSWRAAVRGDGRGRIAEGIEAAARGDPAEDPDAPGGSAAGRRRRARPARRRGSTRRASTAGTSPRPSTDAAQRGPNRCRASRADQRGESGHAADPRGRARRARRFARTVLQKRCGRCAS